jgi:hypothetical protein
MEFKNTLEIVTKDIQDIEKLVSNFKNYSRIPNIELDLALSRLRNVYDLLLMFKDDSGSLQQHTIAESITENPETVVKPTPVVIGSAVPVATDEPAAIMPEEIKVEKTEVVESPVTPANDPEPLVTIPSTSKSKEEKLFINEKLAEHTIKKDVSSKLQGQAIKSISGSLGINDKFFFIRELFGGNAETFRQIMAELDDSRNFNDAYSLLMDRFQWDMESEPVQLLLNLIRRKFITSGNE